MVRWLSVLFFTLFVACGGGKDSVSAKSANELTPEQIDADPLSLLPGSAIALSSTDARAFYGSATLGPQVARLTEKLVPIGEEAGFKASRDVDRVWVASYSTQGLDLAGIIKGKFDPKKIAEVAKNHTPTRSGGMLVESQYANRTLYTVDNVGFTVLTEHTALVGTEAGIRRALDRMRDGLATKRSLPQWMIDTIETKGAATAIAADLSAQDLSKISIAGVSFKWLKGLQKVRVIGNFGEPGMHVAGSLTYAADADAEDGAQGLRDIVGMANMVAAAGVVPRLQDFDAKVEKANVQFKFAVDDQALRSLLAAAAGYLG